MQLQHPGCGVPIPFGGVYCKSWKELQNLKRRTRATAKFISKARGILYMLSKIKEILDDKRLVVPAFFVAIVMSLAVCLINGFRYLDAFLQGVFYQLQWILFLFATWFMVSLLVIYLGRRHKISVIPVFIICLILMFGSALINGVFNVSNGPGVGLNQFLERTFDLPAIVSQDLFQYLYRSPSSPVHGINLLIFSGFDYTPTVMLYLIYSLLWYLALRFIICLFKKPIFPKKSAQA